MAHGTHNPRGRTSPRDVAKSPDGSGDKSGRSHDGGPAGTFDGLDSDELVAPLPPRAQREPLDDDLTASAIDKYLAIQRPFVLFQIRALRKKHPDATPTELLRKIELQYLNAVTATGGGAGAAAVVPGIGTAASLAVTGAETVTFLEMTALYAQAVAEVHGLAVSDPVRARTLVQSLIVGEAAKQIVAQFASEVSGKGGSRQDFWGEMVTRSLPKALVGEASARIRDIFLKEFTRGSFGRTVGRIVPFGIGAVIGGAGNRILARRIVRNADEAFGPAPSTFSLDLNPSAAIRGETTDRQALERGRRWSFFRIPKGKTMLEIEQ